MKRLHVIVRLRTVVAMLTILTLIPVISNGQERGTFTDSRDGRVYHWVKIGSQAWMVENLRFKVPGASWAYNEDSAAEVNFGRLYTWKAAQTACPKGWHLPSDKEWGMLIQSLGGSDMAGQKFQAMDTIRKTPGHAAATPPESSLLGGVRHADGSCIGLDFWGGCWSAGKVNDTVANNVLFAKGAKEMGLSTNDKSSAFSVRCVRK